MKYSDYYEGHECTICHYFCKNRRSLGNHLNKSHQTSIQEYILKYMFDEKVPKCKCGCGEEVNWHKLFYKYNDYISGHNDTGFDITKHKHTKKQIEERNKSIKKSYEENGDKIKEKISNSVKEAWNDEDKKNNMIEGQKKFWKDPENKKKMSEIRQRVWDEQGDELRKKIFTPEFGRKISIANMKRDQTRTSKKEKEFFDHLKSVGIDVNSNGKWFNEEDMVKHYDGYIYNERLLIEYDGVYWHGLDREKDFTYDQVKGITNDFKKNRLAKEKGWALIRISEEANLENIISFDSLIESAYHYQDKNGNIIRDGRFMLSDKDFLLSKQHLLKRHLKEGKEQVEKNYLPLLMDFYKEYVLSNGWFYPEIDNEDIESATYQVIKNANLSCNFEEFSSNGSDATKYLKSMFKSYWDVNDGPVQSFHNDNILRKIIKYRIGLNNSKMYKYKLEGQDVEYNELFDLNFINVRRGFVVQRKAVSFFKPKVACEIYYKFLKDIEYPIVLDPSCGFGARMFGFYSFLKEAEKKGMYYGTEPAKKTFDDLLCLGEEIKNYYNNFEYNILNCGSEDLNIPYKECDLVFTSPPYFDKEKYFNEETQCWKRYPTTLLWKERYYSQTMKNAYKALKNGGKLILNVDKERKDITIECAQDAGFSFDREMRLLLNSGPFSKNRNTIKYEPILIFDKLID